MAGPTHAQWQRGATRGLQKAPSKALSNTLATQRAINKVLRNKTQSLLKSTFTLKLADENASTFSSWYYPKASAFVFEENYKGKTYLWGATASHYNLEEPSLKDPQTGEYIPIKLLAQGHSARNDVSLFAIPPQLKNYFKPLKLAAHAPRKEEKLHSASYFDDAFQIEKNRVVADILPTRILTSLVIKDQRAREGSCGGPILNKKGQIVGMHVGSSSQEKVGFIVPVEHIYELLHAYHNNGQAWRPFYFNGRKIGDININEYVRYIEVWQGNEILQTFTTFPVRAYLDYNHLEKFVDASHADKIIFIIEREPFSMLEKDQHTRQFKITYDLRTFYVSERKKVTI